MRLCICKKILNMNYRNAFGYLENSHNDMLLYSSDLSSNIATIQYILSDWM